MTDLFFIDTETGGLSPETDALLEVGLVHWRDGLVLDTLDVQIQSEGRRVQEAAIKVNGIHLATHDSAARTRVSAAVLIWGWIRVKWPRGWARPAGHNVGFDLGFLRELLALPESDRLLSYRAVDTCGILGFICDAGLVSLQRHSLDAACDHFGIRRQRAHRALDDALAAAELYGHLLRLVRR